MWKYLAGLIVVAAIAGGAFIISGRDNNQDNNGSNAPTPPPTQSTDSSANNNQASSTNKVSISNFAFSPADITIKKGTTVTWTNNDSVAHTVTKDSGSGPESELLENGESYSFTFNELGTFNYHCTPHPQMHGTVTVTE